MTLPFVTDEAAWASDPLDASPTWTTISTDRLVTGTSRRVLGQAGLMTGVYHNNDDALNPWNTSSPWYNAGDGLQPMKKTRRTARWNLLTLDQSNIEASLGGWADNGNATVSRTSVQAVDSWSMLLQATGNGNMSAITPTGGSGAYVGWHIGGDFSAMAYFRADSGGRLCDVSINFYAAGGGFLGGSTGTAITDTSAGWTQATVTVLAANVPTGAYYAAVSARVRNATATEVHYVDQIGLYPMAGVTTWSRGGPYYLFTGFVEKFAAEWPFIAYGDMSIESVDMFKVLTLSKTAGSDYHDAVMADSPDGYYKFGEGENGATSGSQPAAEDSSGNTNTGQFYGSPKFGAAGALPAEAGTAVDFGTRATYVLLPSSATPAGTTDFTLEAWVYPRSFPASGSSDRIFSNNATGEAIELSLAPDGTLFFVVGGVNSGELASSVALTPNRWNHVAAVKAGTTGASNWRVYINGVDVSTSPATYGTGNPSLAASTLLIGGLRVSGVPVPKFDGIIDEAAVYFTALSGATIAAHYDAALGFNDDALAGARIAQLLDLADIPAGDRDLDAGQFLMQPVREQMFDTPPLAYMLKLVESEGWPAALFVSGDGKLTFQDRAHATPSSTATLSDAGTVNYDAGVGPTRSDQGLWTAVAYQAEGGAPQTAVDATAATKYIKRTRTVTGLLNSSDADVATLAASDLARFKTPRDMVDRVVLHPIDDPQNMFPVVLGLELNDRISVVRTDFPGGGSSLTLDVRVTGIEHLFTEEDWHCVLTVEPT